MNKLNFNSLSFEMTRRCNLNCPHCEKGEPQNVDITNRIIDKVLSQVNYATTIFLTGGEPFLAGDQIEYLVNKIIEDKIVIAGFSVITNGTVLDERICKCFNSISNYIKELLLLKAKITQPYTAAITISDDKFHCNLNKKKAYEFYSQYCNDNVKVSFMDRDKRGTGNYDENMLFYSGRAKYLPDKYKFRLDSPDHRIEFCTINEEKWKGNTLLRNRNPTDGMLIKCVMEVSSNGNFGVMYSGNYKNIDDNCMGNIFDSSIAEMIDNWQWKHPIYCKEVDLKNKAEANIINNRNNPNYNANNDNSMITDIDTIENKRKELHHNFMYLSFDEIYNMTEILIELGDAEKTNDLEKQDLCKKRYRKYERVNQEREIAEQFKSHEETHQKYPNLTPKECEIMDYSMSQINDDWESFTDRDFVKECKKRHKDTIQDLIAKNNNLNTLSGLFEELFIQ